METHIWMPVIGREHNAERYKADFLAIMRDAPLQRRPFLVTHHLLMQVAQERADDMAERNYFNHVSPEGYGANHYVRQAGYKLPHWYHADPHSNNIEVLGGGFMMPEHLFEAFLRSSAHRKMVLGEHVSFATQTRIGIGWAYGAPGIRYRPIWCILTCPDES